MCKEKMKLSKNLTIAFFSMGISFFFISCSAEKKQPVEQALVQLQVPPSPKEIVFEKLIFISGKDTLRYRLVKPENPESGKKYPLVLFFHGAAQRGNDNESQLADVPHLLTDSAARKNHPCYILIPQCPLEQQWVNVNWHDKAEMMPETISLSENLSLKLLDSLQKKLSIDSSRLYLVGLSMGGFAVWDLISRYPEKFAVAVPVCGGGDEKQAGKLIHIPIWAFHGKLDDIVMVSRSVNMVNAINSKGGNAKLTIYPTLKHDSWNTAFRDLELFDWLFIQHK
jgi:predicted peptidase